MHSKHQLISVLRPMFIYLFLAHDYVLQEKLMKLGVVITCCYSCQLGIPTPRI